MLRERFEQTRSRLRAALGRTLERSMFRFGRRLPFVRGVVAELQAAREVFRFVPPGHYFSPIPTLQEAKRHAEGLFWTRPRELPGIALNEGEQLALLQQLKDYYRDLPFPEQKERERRYFYDNHSFSHTDAFVLYGMIRHLRPRRIIEVGSGYSSCVMLDTNELFCQNTVSCTFIEPYPDLLLSLIREDDCDRIELLACPVQEVELDRFRELAANDILFIDSTHVVKLGGDVNYLVHQVLPLLRAGVYVHFHDIFYPFEYPVEWVHGGRMWTEAYLLRAFLQFNFAYEIALYNTFLTHFHRQEFLRDMPLCLKHEGASIWLRRRPDASHVVASSIDTARAEPDADVLRQ